MEKVKNWLKEHRDVIGRIVSLLVVIGVTTLIIHPFIWIGFSFVIVKWLLMLLLAAIVSRVIFKKSLKELITGRKEDNGPESW